MKHSFFKTIMALVVLLVSISISSCMTHHHTIGNGAQKGHSIEVRQWYVLWGLIPIGSQDTKFMAGDATDYEIETYYGVIDWFINLFLGPFTIQTRTIEVIK